MALGVAVGLVVISLPPPFGLVAGVPACIGVGLIVGWLMSNMHRSRVAAFSKALERAAGSDYRAPIELPNSNGLEAAVELVGQMQTKLNETLRVLKENEDQSQTLVQLSNLFVSLPQPAQVLSTVLDEALVKVAAKAGRVMLLDEERGDFVVRATRGESLRLGDRLPLDGVEAQVLRTNRPLNIRPGVRERTVSRLRSDKPEGEVLCVPLRIGPRVLGTLTITQRTDGTGFTHRDQELLTYLANSASIVLENSQLQRHLTTSFLNTIRALAQALDARDRYTGRHSIQVAEYSVAIARTLKLSPDEMDGINFGATLHDVGKIAISDLVLNKPDRLTPEEFEAIKAHPEHGAAILAPAQPQLPWSILPMVRNHHERMDGTGYPDRLRGDNIPFHARIVAIADFFDALTSDRVYRPGLPVDHVILEVRRGIRNMFDPQIVGPACQVLPGEYERLRDAELRGGAGAAAAA